MHRASARDALLAGGYDVVEFPDGARALAYLRKDAKALPASQSQSKALQRREGQTTLRPAVLSVGDIDAIVVD